MSVDSYICPTCGSEVKVGAGCPGCAPRKRRRKKRVSAGPRKRRSWEQDSIHDGIGVSEDEFDYEDFIEREFGDKPHRKIGIKWYWWVTALALVSMMIGGILAAAIS